MLTFARSTVLIDRGEMRLHIDLDEGRPNNRGTNKFYFIMKKTTTIQMSALNAYLSGRVAWDNTVLECMSKCFLCLLCNYFEIRQ